MTSTTMASHAGAPLAPASAVTRIILTGWFVVTALAAAYLLGAHVPGLPVPMARDPRLLAGVAARRSDRPLVLHVLSAGCRCSGRVLARLEARAPRSDVDEQIVIVTSGAQAQTGELAAREGFHVEQRAPEELAEALGVEVAPVLVIADAHGDIAYVGGYTERKQAAAVHTDELIDAVLRGDRPEPLPVLGCAVTQAMRATTDPWGLR